MSPAPPTGFGADRAFEPGGVIGRGGMGEVRHAWDPGLQRDVALKTALGGAPDAAARLVREARLTARLAHPNIIPVFAADQDPAGRPRYAMRLLDGKSLGLALHTCPDLTARLGFVRNLVDVAGAVAYANGNGVIHADLSASNVIVGAYGETVVADWGLAVTVEEAAAGVEPGGGTIGTRSPEQARGDALDARSDVYGLGALLYEILTGKPPRDATAGPVPPVRSLCPEAPPELAAIAERALAPAPPDRYPDARAFGDDLLAWFEGRRVSAHAYSVWELARRLARAWRAPLATAAIGLAGVLAVLVIGLARTAHQRDRALRAEGEAVTARGEAERSLARALVAQALVAAAEDREMDAEVLAAHALALGESADARGVLSAFGGPVGLRSAARVPAPACRVRVPSPDGTRFGCVRDDEISLRATDSPAEALATTTRHPASAVFLSDGATLRFATHEGGIWDWTPPAEPQQLPAEIPNRSSRLGAGLVPGVAAYTAGESAGFIGADGRYHNRPRVCAGHGAPRVALVDPTGRLLVACEDAAVIGAPPDGPDEPLAAGRPDDGAPTSLAWDLPRGQLVVGTATGQIIVLDGVTGARRARVAVLKDGIDVIDAVGGRIAVVAGDRVAALDADGTRFLSIRARQPAVVWREAGTRLEVISDVAERWEVGGAGPLRRIDTGVGIAAVDLDHDDRRLAVGGGDGVARIYDRATGALLQSIGWQPGVIKDVAFSPDRALLAIAAAGRPGVRLYDTTRWLPVWEDEDASRRVAWLADGTLLASSWKRGLLQRTPTGERRTFGDFEAHDLESDRTGAHVVAVTPGHEMFVITPGAPLGLREVAAGEGSTNADIDATQVVVAQPDRVDRFDAAGARVGAFPVDGVPRDIALSPDGTLMATGMLDGMVAVFRTADGTSVAHLHGHDARVVSVSFSDDGAWLVSGGWDGTVRFWSTRELTQPAAALVAEVEAVWRRHASDVLSTD